MAQRNLGPPARALTFEPKKLAAAFVLGLFPQSTVLMAIHVAMAAAFHIQKH